MLHQGRVVACFSRFGRGAHSRVTAHVVNVRRDGLLAPVEAHLEGATEVLIIPHKELFEVPWAALFDSQTGQYLIQRFVLRVRDMGSCCLFLNTRPSATQSCWLLLKIRGKLHAHNGKISEHARSPLPRVITARDGRGLRRAGQRGWRVRACFGNC